MSKVQQIQNLLNKRDIITIPDVCRELNTTESTAVKWLFYLCAVGKAKFEKKGRYYLFMRKRGKR